MGPGSGSACGRVVTGPLRETERSPVPGRSADRSQLVRCGGRNGARFRLCLRTGRDWSAAGDGTEPCSGPIGGPVATGPLLETERGPVPGRLADGSQLVRCGRRNGGWLRLQRRTGRDWSAAGDATGPGSGSACGRIATSPLRETEWRLVAAPTTDRSQPAQKRRAALSSNPPLSVLGTCSHLKRYTSWVTRSTAGKLRMAPVGQASTHLRQLVQKVRASSGTIGLTTVEKPRLYSPRKVLPTTWSQVR